MSQELAQNKTEDCSIEDILSQVEDTIANLEAEDISLEDSFVQYKKGMELLKVCNEKIDAIEKKVLILNGEGETDEF
ncbi:MAG: exodeoxyribonuclease VII small subunit [Lachnospiraceae bacterium]|nr:exodeoxyribonuclease VII small subunit [Clostridiales bacterium]MDY3109028.1 exodeoxyribonuclease VII small subunit [Lachnospiraceae bacterium]